MTEIFRELVSRLYEDLKRNTGIAVIFCILGIFIGWMANDYFTTLSGQVKVGKDTFITQAELQNRYVLLTDCKKYSDNNQVKAVENIAEWKNAYDTLKLQNDELIAQRDNYYLNCSISGKIKELEQVKDRLEDEMKDLTAPGRDGNPADGMSNNNRILYNQRLRQVNEYGSRISALEVQLKKIRTEK